MADTLTVSGAIEVVPTTGPQDGVSGETIPLASSVTLQAKQVGSPYTLTSDSPVTVALGPCSKINYVRLRVVGGYCTARLTNGSGVQVLTFEPHLEIRSDTQPYTALTITRPPAVQVTVHVFLGDKA